MADMPIVVSRDMLGEAMKVVKTHQKIREDIAEKAREIQAIRDEEQQMTQSNEIVVPYGS